MIDESPAGDDFKRVLRGKLDALLALAEATDCRRVRLLSTSPPLREGRMPPPWAARRRAVSAGLHGCDNCLQPPTPWMPPKPPASC